MTELSLPSVAHILWSGRVGGIERLVRDLAVEQAAHGVNVTVVFGQANGPFTKTLPNAGAEVVDLGLVSGHDLRPGRIRSASRALRCCDVVHVHSFNPVFFEVARRANRPLVFTEHGVFGLGGPPRARDRLKRRLKRHFLRTHVASLAANSRHTAGRLCDVYGIDPRVVTVIYNGISPNDVEPVARVGGPELRIGFIGRLARMKRVDRLILAFAQARNREDMHLVLAGDGPRRAEVLDLCRANGLEAQVSFLGFQEDVHGILSSIDVVVLPSQAEPFGLVILEACAAGAVPVVFRDSGGALEALPPDGLIVSDVAGLATTLDDLVGSPALAATARKRRADWVRRTFPISSTAQAYKTLYQSAMSGD